MEAIWRRRRWPRWQSRSRSDSSPALKPVVVQRSRVAVAEPAYIAPLVYDKRKRQSTLS